MKVTIVFEDEPTGLVNVRVEFDPEVSMDSKPTAAQSLAISALAAIQSSGHVYEDDDED